ncbi:hypothetical protein P6144_18025 [Sphingomonas sp. HITSZ_GF]|uniref:hypothetical protein n=1 Tax=Sphingomonas sp. HITSZ_GF TaxID=3037247 RepID=UPI00240D54C6|nr:hypothetical protein [Sphingomonas sp. HITSZ_GF]MDG2535564.1 hypothetical protein [Sphingomonas sp. HITSZ_GF]
MEPQEDPQHHELGSRRNLLALAIAAVVMLVAGILLVHGFSRHRAQLRDEPGSNVSGMSVLGAGS